MALLETRLKHKGYFIELCGFGPWKQNLKLHKWLCLSRLRQKKISQNSVVFWPRQTMHQKRWRGSKRARQHCLEGIAEKKFEIASKLQKLLHRSSKFAILHSSCHLLSPLLEDIHKIIPMNLLLAISYFTMLNRSGCYLLILLIVKYYKNVKFSSNCKMLNMQIVNIKKNVK